MRNFLEQGLFQIIMQTIIALSVFALFVSIFLDFTFFSRRRDVKKEKRSVVDTGTMTLFFFIFYLIIWSKAGNINVKSQYIKDTVIILGTAAITSGCVINIHGRLNLGRNWANHIKIYSGHTLIQTGMYKLVRHPLYASIILMFYGASLVYRNAISFAAVTLIFIPFMYYRAKQEEKLLLQNFSEYESYKNKTGMFIPKFITRKE